MINWARRLAEPIKWENWLYGDVYCEGPRAHKRAWKKTRNRMARAVRRHNRKKRIPFRNRVKGNVVSGYRSYSEQKRLYDAYRNGTGNLAAIPGTSNHEKGIAADIYLNGQAAANVDKESFTYFGIAFRIHAEPWHGERLG